MKKGLKLSIVILAGLMLGITNVKAEEYYYVNDNGITFTKDQYDFITEMYYDGYQKYMTEEDMSYFNKDEMIPGTVESKYYIDYSSDFNSIGGGYRLMGTAVETQSKKLKISNFNNHIAISCSWKASPNVRSYDLIGAYLNGPNMIAGPTSKITYSSGTITPSATKETSKGFGSVLKMPNGGNSIVISTTFTISGSGRIYGSYQHAKSSISLNKAKSFNISSSGLGQVFSFSSVSIRNKYDAMSGVYIDA